MRGGVGVRWARSCEARKLERQQQVKEWLQNEKRVKGKEEGERAGRDGVGWGAQKAVLSLGPKLCS